MKKLLTTLTTLLVVTMILSGQIPAKKENPFGLKLVSDMNTYTKAAKESPANQLVDLEKSMDGLVMDIRYSTPNNFTGQAVYPAAKAFARKPVADALLKIQRELNKKGIGLKIYDAYRPYSVTLEFFKVYPDTNFVASPRTGSRHNRGCAIDLTLIDLKSGLELEMPTPFDDFTEKASHSYLNLPDSAIKNRQILRKVMVNNGFDINPSEWWHYDFRGWRNFPIMDLSFEELSNN